MQTRSHARKALLRHGAAILATLPMVAGPALPAFAATTPTTPIQHIIVIIGENRTFDHIYATYQSRSGDAVSNLLSKGIVNQDGTPGPNWNLARQSSATVDKVYSINPTKQKKPYANLPPIMTDGAPSVASDSTPPPFATMAAATATIKALNDGLTADDAKILTTGATGLPNDSIDTRIPNAASPANGPYLITQKISSDSYTASPVHRFYQMWQETDCSVAHATAANPSGCLNDLFPWVETTVGAGTNGNPQASGFTDQSTGEGSASMGFFNIANGDVPVFKRLSDAYTISDNFHQSIEGGTGANHIALGTGLAIYYTDATGKIATPPTLNIENPNPQDGTNNWYTQDGYSGGSYSDCSNAEAPGVKQVLSYLSTLPYTPGAKCEKGAYYLLNNYNPGYYGDGTINTSAFTIPPSPVHTIADPLNAAGISWAYFGAGWNAYVKDPSSEAGSIYCTICNPFQYETNIMSDKQQRAEHLRDVSELAGEIRKGTLPAVSIVKPDGLADGHPASSKVSIFEAFTRRIVNLVKSNPTLYAHTAILITMDEGGGYWDSGYIQPLDFFGDGTRIPAIMVSPYSTGGHVSHSYTDHVSFLKFVEKNWQLPPVSANGRDNLPNPVVAGSNPYVPLNSPAIGDLMDMFDFTQAPNLN
jgi:phospholipase C